MFHSTQSSAVLQQQKGSLKTWFLAIRPRTLPLSFPPIFVGTALAAQTVEHLNWLWVLCALLCSLGIQIGTNLVNDALDFKKGADGNGRLGPKRMTQEGLLSYHQVLFAACLCFGCTGVCAIPLILSGGWPLLGILILSIACGYLYTGGPYPLAYIGVSDLFVLLFFGWISTCSVYFLQTHTLHVHAFLAGTQIGLLAVVTLAINNLRDHLSDALVNKRTFAVRFGPYFARLEITLCSILPFILGFLWFQEGFFWTVILPFLALPAMISNLRSIWLTEPSRLYNQFLAKSALCQLLFGCCLAVGILMDEYCLFHLCS